MSSSSTIVFVCLHGAAKSVIASSYFNRLAAERRLGVRSAAAGVEPEPEIPAAVKTGLLRDGLDVGGERPRRVAREELRAARRIVSFGCDLGDVAPDGLVVERWDDVPMVSDGFPAARDVILGRVTLLLDRLAAAGEIWTYS